MKSFGNRMVNDHGKAGDELKTLATNKGLALPADLDADAKKTQDELSKKSGKDFDKAYIADMVKDHEKDVAEFQKESTGARQPIRMADPTNGTAALEPGAASPHCVMPSPTSARTL